MVAACSVDYLVVVDSVVGVVAVAARHWCVQVGDACEH